MLLILFVLSYFSYVMWLIYIINNRCKNIQETENERLPNLYNLYVQDIRNKTNNNGNGMITELWRISPRAKYIKEKTYEMKKLFPNLDTKDTFTTAKIWYTIDEYTDKTLL